MTKEQSGQGINIAIEAAAGENWQNQYKLHEGNAPGHQIVSQIIALIGDNPEEIAHVEARVGSPSQLSKYELTLIVFTSKLLLKIELEPGGSPTTEVVLRTSLRTLKVKSAPVVTFQEPGSDWTPLVLEAVYPSLNLSLPFDSHRRVSSDAVARLLPALVGDLADSIIS